MAINKTSNTLRFSYHDNTKIRLDKFLAENLQERGYSRVFINHLITQGEVSVNNKTILVGKQILKPDDEIIINLADQKVNNDDLVATKIDIPIIYEDDDIIVIDKPNNLVVHPGAGNKDNTLVNGLLFSMKELSDVNDARPGIVHRIDKQTTGLLLVAKNNRAHYFLSEELKHHKIKRIYIALVHGKINERSGTIDAPIARDKNNRLKMVVAENGKKAVTHFKVIETFNNYSLIECQLETGRTHQIRVHLAWINHPVVNDPVYSKYKIEDKNIGQYLHAQKITFIHPTSKKVMSFTDKLPDFFERKLQIIRKENIK